MMNSLLHAPPVHYTSYYGPQVSPPLLPRDHFVLDLSKKPPQHVVLSDYKRYPSPKSRPVSYSSREEYECTKCNLQCQGKADAEEKFLSHPLSPSPSSTSENSSSQTKSIPLIAANYLSSTDVTNLDSEEIKRLMEDSAKRYAEFKETMLQRLCNNNNSTNHNMRRLQNNDHKTNDAEYLEKRRKNNEAAKRSRDARRNKQDDTAIRATFLEQENIMLRIHLRAEREDLERLKNMELERR